MEQQNRERNNNDNDKRRTTNGLELHREKKEKTEAKAAHGDETGRRHGSVEEVRQGGGQQR